MVYVFIAGVLWGTIGLFVNTMAGLGASPSQICTLRMTFAFAIMTLLALVRNGRRALLLDRRTLLICALLGLVSHGAFNICYTASIRINGMGIACVLMYTAPVFTAIASWICFRERFSAMKILALLVNIAGCILTVTGGDFSGADLNMWGLLAGLGSGFGYGMAAIFGRMAGERTDPFTMSAYSYFFAMVFLYGVLRPELTLDAKILGTGLVYGLVPTSLAYVLYYAGIKRIRDTGRVPVIASIEPVTAIILGLLVYGEKIGTANMIGVAVVLISIIMMVKSE